MKTKVIRIGKNPKMRMVDLRETAVDQIVAKVRWMVRNRRFDMTDAEDSEYEELEEMLWRLARL